MAHFAHVKGEHFREPYMATKVAPFTAYAGLEPNFQLESNRER